MAVCFTALGGRGIVFQTGEFDPVSICSFPGRVGYGRNRETETRRGLESQFTDGLSRTLTSD
ncbi:hypothetical protein RISK_003986 [Rhodopirellula islandica]|uniref:Uncharacterized protein n=1 Tax=Rhodopirellula islandica TaxID=595434 RepID=A0A0J1BBK0_RHOIS|nr:hypothetical protein RISK_003986 [Rhodopirellula islandica]